MLTASADWEGGVIYAVSVIYDEGTFKVWYTAGSVLTSGGTGGQDRICHFERRYRLDEACGESCPHADAGLV